MRKVEKTSLKAFYDLKESGAISGLQQLAFLTVRRFYQEHGYWPTTREAHAFLVLEKGNKMAQIKGPEYIRRRLSELVQNRDDNHPDLLEKVEPREQTYLLKMVDGIESTAEAHPLKITYIEKETRDNHEKVLY